MVWTFAEPSRSGIGEMACGESERNCVSGSSDLDFNFLFSVNILLLYREQINFKHLIGINKITFT